MPVSRQEANEAARTFLAEIEDNRAQRNRNAFGSTNYETFDSKMIDLERQAVENAMAVWKPLAAEILHSVLGFPVEIQRV